MANLFINGTADVTMAPGVDPIFYSYTASLDNEPMPIQGCIQKNGILKGRGKQCYNQMCECLTGSSYDFGCPVDEATNKKIAAFCGSYGTPSFYNHGAYWNRLEGDQALPGTGFTGPFVNSSMQLGMYSGNNSCRK
jgi:hypothetical protein